MRQLSPSDSASFTSYLLKTSVWKILHAKTMRCQSPEIHFLSLQDLYQKGSTKYCQMAFNHTYLSLTSRHQFKLAFFLFSEIVRKYTNPDSQFLICKICLFALKTFSRKPWGSKFVQLERTPPTQSNQKSDLSDKSEESYLRTLFLKAWLISIWMDVLKCILTTAF